MDFSVASGVADRNVIRRRRKSRPEEEDEDTQLDRERRRVCTN
jgi:hypothetical protein